MENNIFGIKDNDDKKIPVRPCMFIHPPKAGDNQEIIYRPMQEKGTGRKMFYMQCSICGACGPAANTMRKAALKWNARKVKVLSREQFEEINKEKTEEMEKAVQDGE